MVLGKILAHLDRQVPWSVTPVLRPPVRGPSGQGLLELSGERSIAAGPEPAGPVCAAHGVQCEQLEVRTTMAGATSAAPAPAGCSRAEVGLPTRGIPEDQGLCTASTHWGALIVSTFDNSCIGVE